MKKTHLSRRLLSLILALALVVSLFAGLALSAFAVPSLPAANTKVRHIDCTALSAQAIAYYGSGQYSYAQMSQLSGVNNAEDCWATTQNNPLYTRLQTLMSSTQTYNTTYTGTSDGSLASYWVRTDAQNSSSTYYCFYSDLLYGSSGFPSDMQREHIWPKSNASYYQTNGGSDLHHLRPSVGSLNNSKSNKSFGEMTHDSSNTKYVVSGDASTVYYSGTYFEPKDDIKGDVARILLYVYCRWGQPNLYTDVASNKLPAYDSDDSQNNGTRAIDGRATLLKWMENDPVDTWEMERNDLVQNVQGNRNVFIDYPEYAWLVFGLTPPSTMTTPSGMAAAGASNYTITAVSNNNNYGTVSLSGSVITATPASGYYAAGYQVTSGSATVTQSGNTFTVSAGSNCTVTIIFAQIQTYTVTYMANGYNAGSATAQAGSSVTLPSSTTAVSGWDFIGWTDNAGYTNGSSQPSNYYAKGTGYTVNGNVTLYAVYSQTTGGGGASTYVSTAAADVTAGQYVIGALRSDSATNNYYFATSTVSSGDITTTSSTLTVTGSSFAEASLPSGAAVFTFAGDNTNGFTIDAGSGNYLGFTAASNRKLAFSSSYATTKWEVKAKANSLNANGVYLNCTSGTTYAISENSTGSGAIRGYSSGTAYRGIYLFKLTAGSGTTTYSINPSGQQHTHSMSYVAANPASCTADGNSAYYYCADCGGYFTDAAGNNPTTQAATVIAALGHNYVAGTAVAPTAGSAGYTTYTCSRCGDSYNDDYTYLMTFVAPDGTTTQSASANSTATLPGKSAYDGWTFAGWVKNTYDNTTTAPTETVYTTSYSVTNESVTFYALYTKTETDTGATTPSGYKLSDSAPAAGESVIIALKSGSTYYALPHVTNGQTPTSLSGTELTISNGIVSNYSDVTWTVAATNNSSYPVQLTYGSSYYFKMNSGKFAYTGTGSTGYLAFASVSGGGFTVSNANSTTRYLASSSTSFTVSNNSTDAVTVYIFKYEEGTTGTQTTTYTTQFNTSCTHPNMQSTAANAATCTAAGNSAYYTCPDCGKYFSDAAGNTEIAANSWVIPASGHDYQDTVTPATCTAQGYTTHVCSRCGDTTVDTYVAALGHNYESSVTTAATCVNDGVRTYTCSRCGDSYTETILATGEHSYESAVTTPATCGQAGVMTYTCSVCGASYTEEIPATGEHNYVAAVTEPTTSAAGYTTYTCSVCGDSYVDQDSYTYRVTYLTPAGVAAPASVISGENTLVTPPTLSDTNGWTFVGWVKNSYDNVTTAPTEMIYDAENRVHVTNECLTLYALFTKTETSGGGTPVTTYELVDSASDVDAGTYVITWENSQYLPSETTANKNPAVGTGITVSNDKLTNTVTSDMLWTFAGDNTNGFTVTHTANGTTWHLGASNTAQGIVVDTSGATSGLSYNWTASVDGTYGMLFRCSDGGTRNLAVYTPTSGTPTWRYYTTGASYKGALRLYKETTSGGGTSTTTYTTVFAVTCAHENLTPVAAVAPTCETAGNSAYWICDDCGLYFSDAQATTETTLADVTIAATGHAWGSWTHDANSDPSTHTRVCGNDASHTETVSCTFDAGVVTVEPTYTSTGVKTYTCADCGWTYTETVPALTYTDAGGGSYKLLTDLSKLESGDKVVIYNPANAKAMTSTLYNSYYLTGADATVSGNTLTPASDIVVWTVTKNQDGSFTFTQGTDYALYGYASGNYIDLAVENGDGYINKWELAALETEYDGTVSMLCQGLVRTTSTTTYNNVYLEYYSGKFQVYGMNGTPSSTAYAMQLYVYEQPATQVKGVTLTLNGQIDTNAYIAIPDSVVEAGLSYSIDGGTAVALSTSDKQANGLYKFSAKMPARDMNTKVTLQFLQNGQPMTFLDSDGNEVSEFEYCVEDYLQTVINDSDTYEASYPGLTALCKAMSDYGHYAQIQQNYNMGNLWTTVYNENLANVDTSVTSVPSLAEQGDGVKFYGVSVLMLSETTVRYWFRITGTGSFTATVDGQSAELQHYDGGSYYYVDVANIAAKDLGKTFTVSVSDGTNSATFSGYGAYSYAQQVVEQNSDADLVNLVKSIRYYGDCAVNYFG